MSLNLLNGNHEALALLDWFELTSNISSLSHFDLTKRRLASAPHFKDSDFIQRDLDRLEFYLTNFDDFSIVFASKFRMLPESEDFFSIIPDIKKGKFFEPKDLNFFALLFEAYSPNYSLFKDLEFEGDFNISNDIIQKIRRLFLAPLREFIDFSGNATYEKHPLLKKLYSEVLALESDLRSTIQKVAKNEIYSPRLQMDNYDIINDRYVLAIRSDSYTSDLGPIISRSQSGMTLFIEPLEVKEKGNRRIFLLSEIEATILRLTIDLSKIIHEYSSEFKAFADWTLELDWINTKATFSLKLGLSKPILASQFHFEINGLFHPLLHNPIKNNLILDNKSKGLVISGPNTGGKTVALKSFCLSIMLLHIGLFLPASYAEIYPVQDLFYFSHDHQDLSAGLSSFASEAKYYLELLQNLGARNLIIIDEIFNSTSSEEASALAISFLEEIHLRSSSKIVISTHHQVLKTFMHARGDYVSAHVGYDFDSNKPTYKLILGEPGSSLAFTIFDTLSLKFGLKNDISSKAKKLLDEKHVTYESLLQELSQKKIELEKLLTANKSLHNDLKNQRASMEGVLFLEREKILTEYTKKIRSFFSQAENLFNEVKRGEIANRKTLSNQIGIIQSQLNSESASSLSTTDSDSKYAHYRQISFDDLALNMAVFSLSVKKDVKIVQLNPRKKEAQIQHGALSVWVNIFDLRWPSGAKPPAQRITINIDRKVKGDIEIDCRGFRLVEFQKVCEQAIEEVLSGDIPFVTIIHGHGDGILKNWLRNYLKKDFKDLRWENIEGNDGCTKIYS